MSNHGPLLLIEDTPSLQMVYEGVLRNAGYVVHTATNGTEGLRMFREHAPTIVLLDLILPDRDGLEVMAEMLALRPETSVIVITANGSINKAVEAMRAGAYEFLVKPFDEQRFLGTIENARRSQVTGAAAAAGHGRAPPAEPQPLGEFIGSSAAMAAVYAKIRSVAQSTATVFITGESGTGKELCAQAVHDHSNRASGPFIALNCGAIPPDLLESEVFGHLRGSFTGAISDKLGAAVAADGGTLFLDEVCEMDMALQTKLLRFLQTSTVQPVGATRPRKVNVRIVCATNRDPMEEVLRGRFREDLYYRLHVVPIVMPPLRQRGDDVITIAEAALARLSIEEKHHFTGMSEDVRALFRRLPWPGNVRQLLNVLRNVVVLNPGGEVAVAMLPPELIAQATPEGAGGTAQTGPGRPGIPRSAGPGQNQASAAPRATDAGDAAGHPGDARDAGAVIDLFAGQTLAQIEQAAIEAAIQRHGGSLPRAARELGVSPSTLYRKRQSWAARKPD